MAITAESEVKSQNNVASAAGKWAEGEASGAAIVEEAVSEAGQEESSDQTCEKGRGTKEASGDKAKDHGAKREEEVGVEVEPRTGVSFPVRQEDGKQLNSVGLREKSILGVGLKIYGFGEYIPSNTPQYAQQCLSCPPRAIFSEFRSLLLIFFTFRTA